MNTMLIAIISFGATGLVLGVLLAVAARVFRVESDPRVERVAGLLPGVNCGACGFPGCAGYAAAVVQSGAAVNLCTVGGADVAASLAAVMGVEATPAQRRVARLFCQGGRTASPERFSYRGIISCAAVNITAGGNKRCSYGCLGMGDCVLVCPFGAIRMSGDGLPVVDEALCTACGKCLQACPRGLFELVPARIRVIVACRSQDKGADTRRACATGCIACMRCVKACPSAAIRVDNNLARVDYARCTNEQSCVSSCPQHTIKVFPEPC